MARLIQLIETEDRRGLGRDGDPVRLVTQYFTPEGELVVEKEDLHSPTKKAMRDLYTALNDAGPAPDQHRDTMARHRREWPALWRAIDELERQTDKPKGVNLPHIDPHAGCLSRERSLVGMIKEMRSVLIAAKTVLEEEHADGTVLVKTMAALIERSAGV